MKESGINLTHIGKYEVLGILGSGSMGVVYKAKDPEIGRIVAIKMIRPSILQSLPDPQLALQQFQTEARSAGNLRHPHLITIFEVNRVGESPYMVMDYVEGRGLDSIIENNGKLSFGETIHFMSQVAQGLDYAHSRGVIHRDIKPSNILIDRSETAFILDFGVAFIASMERPKDDPVYGSPGYMSPEQILNERLTASSDLFSFATICFECLMGKRPFGGEDFTSIVSHILENQRTPILDLNPEAPESLEHVFDKAFHQDPGHRYVSAHDLIQEIRRCYLNFKSPPRPEPHPKPMVIGAPSETSFSLESFQETRKRNFLVGGTFFALMVIFGTGSMFLANQKHSSTSIPVQRGPFYIGLPDEAVSRISNRYRGKTIEELTHTLESRQNNEEELILSLQELQRRSIFDESKIGNLLSHPSSVIRLTTVRGLGESPQKISNNVIERGLNDRDSATRQQWGFLLMEKGEAKHLPILRRALLSESDAQSQEILRNVIERIISQSEHSLQ